MSRGGRIDWPPPAPEPREEPSHPWARPGVLFDWAAERDRQRREGARWVESEEERLERLASILRRRRKWWQIWRR